MPVRTRRTATDQMELFCPPVHRPLWNDLPERVKAELRELVAQILRTHAEANATVKVEKEVSDD